MLADKEFLLNLTANSEADGIPYLTLSSNENIY